MAAKKTVKKRTVSKKAASKKTNAEPNQTGTEKKEKKEKVDNLVRERRLFIADLIRKQKFTDEEIVESANETYPVGSGNIKNPFKLSKVNGIRWHIRHGNGGFGEADESIEKIVIHSETKKPVKKSELPTQQKKAKKDKESADRLAKYGVKTKNNSKQDETTEPVEKPVKKVRKRAAKKQTTKKTSDK